MATDEYTYSGFHTWTCPTGVTSAYIEVFGAGGGGGSGEYFNGNGGGGGSGGYSNKTFSTTPSTNYTVYVGDGGSGGGSSDGNTGGSSYFHNTSTVLAYGGGGGGAWNNGGSGGYGAPLGVGDYRETGQAGNAYNGGAYALYGAGGDGGDMGGMDTNGWSGTDGAVLITYTVSDTTSPSSPVQSAATVNGENAITMNWAASTDNIAVTGYQTRINGGAWSDRGNVLTYQYTGLIPATSYTFEVRAYDAAGNFSTVSNSVSATTSSAPVPPGSAFFILYE